MTKVIVDREKLADRASEAWDAADKGYDPMTLGEHGGTEDLGWLMRAATADAPSVDEVVNYLDHQPGCAIRDAKLDSGGYIDLPMSRCTCGLNALLTKLRGE